MQRQEQCSSNVLALTHENMLHHEARHGNVSAYPVSAGHCAMIGEVGLLRIGGEITPSTKTKPKTCGMALAMVAIFCYFPGISMMVSVATVGFSNRSVVGIVFTAVAVALSVASAVLCLYRRGKSRELKYKAIKSSTAPTASVAAKSDRRPHADRPLSSRDELTTENEISSACEPSVTEVPKSPSDPILAKKIADSFPLQRYFADIATVSGPFDLSHEEMDRLTSMAIRGQQTSPQRHIVHHKLRQEEYSSSADSAIDIDSDIPSLEAALFL